MLSSFIKPIMQGVIMLIAFLLWVTAPAISSTISSLLILVKFGDKSFCQLAIYQKPKKGEGKLTSLLSATFCRLSPAGTSGK
jgi:hypothetical protein